MFLNEFHMHTVFVGKFRSPSQTGDSVSFAAVDLNRLPCYSPEAVNICSVIDKQNEKYVL